MKKIIQLILSLIFLFSLTSCLNGNHYPDYLSSVLGMYETNNELRTYYERLINECDDKFDGEVIGIGKEILNDQLMKQSRSTEATYFNFFEINAITMIDDNGKILYNSKKNVCY